MGCRTLGLLVLLLAAQSVTAAPASGHETGFLDRSVVVDGVEYRYEVYVPRDYDAGRTWPIILMLHGGGEYGSDGIRPTAGGLANAIRLHPERFPSIVVFAQGHADGTPSWQLQGGKAALKEVNQAIAEFHGDPSRVYLTGASAGGNGAWFLAYHHPERFAGALLVCGFVSDFTGLQSHVFYPGIAGQGPDRYAKVAEAVHALPMWIVHGDADKNVSVEESRRMAAALKALGANVRYTELPGADHKGAWEFAYADEEITKWLLAQRRSMPAKSAAGASNAVGHVIGHPPTTLADWADGAMLFEGLGGAHRAITTTSQGAQSYFDQGLRFMWSFNHDEATRSFAKAAEMDPQCGPCYWGVALTVGPNYNLPFLVAERAAVAFDALRKAQRNDAQASPVERSLIAALAKRYPNSQPLDSEHALPVLTAYAEAMGSVARRFPADLDVQTLHAESLMNLHAWKLWRADGTPAPGTEQIVSILESVIARDPRHMGANHYYIHALEASPHPEKALASAAKLPQLAPSAAHMLHMPAHIFHRLGRYEEAAAANRVATLADEAYTARVRPPDYYPAMYTAHNHQFLAYSAAMEGRRAETLAAVDRSREIVSDDMLLDMPGIDWYIAESYAGRVRFGLWQEMLALPAPNRKLAGLAGGYLYGRAVALAATGHVNESRTIVHDLQNLSTSVPADALAGQNTVKDVLAVAIPIAEARIAEAEHRPHEAVSLLRQAVSAEDQLAYDEPNDWFFPARHILGAALLRTGAAHEAESVYREDLRKNPANGWSLYGLAAALQAQGKAAEATQIRNQFQEAWRHSDIVLTASAF